MEDTNKIIESATKVVELYFEKELENENTVYDAMWELKLSLQEIPEMINHKTIVREPFKIGGDECVDLSEKTIKQKELEEMIEVVKSIQKVHNMFISGLFGFPL